MKLKFGAIATPWYFELGIGMAVRTRGTSFPAHISDAAGLALPWARYVFGGVCMCLRMCGHGLGVAVGENVVAQHLSEAKPFARQSVACEVMAYNSISDNSSIGSDHSVVGINNWALAKPEYRSS